jgi:heme a synthase
MDTTGFDLTPWLRMAGMGLALASGPLAWLALGHQRRRRAQGSDTTGTRVAERTVALQGLRALTLLTLFLTFDLVLFGAFTRLSDSGLGCPDWPGCYGHASPLGAHADIASAQAAMPTGPVTAGKAWIEMLHRYMATAVGVLILTLTLAHWRVRQAWTPVDTRLRLPSWGWAVVTLLAVCAQGAFGALTVTMKLFPAIVTLHLLGGLTLIALLAAQAAHYDRSVQRLVAGTPAPPTPTLCHSTPHPGPSLPVFVSPLAYAALVAVGLLVVVQIALGGWVSTNYAVLACSQFPTCQGSWWPPMDFEQGFTLWRALGQTASGAPIDFAALTAIHYTHRLMAYAVLAALAMCARAMWRTPGLARPGRVLAALIALQLLTGLSNVVLDWPLIAALAHTGGAAAIVGVIVWALCSCAPGAQQRQ